MRRIRIYLLLILTATSLLTACDPGGSSPSAAAGLSATVHSSAVLENGMRIISHPLHDSQVPLVTLAVQFDSASDSVKDIGKGYPSLLGRLIATNSEQSSAAEFNKLGSALNIDVQSDALLLSVTVLKDDAAVAFKELISRFISGFDEAKINQERESIITRLQASRTRPAVVAQNLLNSTVFRGTARGRSTEDLLNSLSEASASDVNNYIEKAIRPEKISIAIVGALDTKILDDLVSMVNPLQSRSSSAARDEIAEGDEAGSDEVADEEPYVPIFVLDADTPTVRFYLHRHLPGLQPEEYYQIQAVNLILNGRSTFGRLTALQMEQKLSTPIISSLQMSSLETSHMISADVPTSKTKEIIERTVGQLDLLHSGRVMNTRLLGQEVADARGNLIGQLLRQTETTEQQAKFMLWAERYGFPSNLPREHLNLIRKIDEQSLLETIEKYFIPRLNTMVAIGPSRMLRQQLRDFGDIEIVKVEDLK